MARSNVSWARSSAVSGSPRYRHIFQAFALGLGDESLQGGVLAVTAAIRSWVR